MTHQECIGYHEPAERAVEIGFVGPPTSELDCTYQNPPQEDLSCFGRLNVYSYCTRHHHNIGANYRPIRAVFSCLNLKSEIACSNHHGNDVKKCNGKNSPNAISDPSRGVLMQGLHVVGHCPLGNKPYRRLHIQPEPESAWPLDARLASTRVGRVQRYLISQPDPAPYPLSNESLSSRPTFLNASKPSSCI
jgi:hypothetical protein